MRFNRRNSPYGTYAAHVIRNEPVADVLSDAFVTAPGPTLADVQAELAARRVDRDEVRAGAHAVSEAVRDAFENEAAGIAADAELELATKVARPVARASGDDTAAEAASADDDDRDLVVVRHRFDRRRGETARRIITLRDKRRGRPPGSDPPAD